MSSATGSAQQRQGPQSVFASFSRLQTLEETLVTSSVVQAPVHVQAFPNQFARNKSEMKDEVDHSTVQAYFQPVFTNLHCFQQVNDSGLGLVNQNSEQQPIVHTVAEIAKDKVVLRPTLQLYSSKPEDAQDHWLKRFNTDEVDFSGVVKMQAVRNAEICRAEDIVVGTAGYSVPRTLSSGAALNAAGKIAGSNLKDMPGQGTKRLTGTFPSHATVAVENVKQPEVRSTRISRAEATIVAIGRNAPEQKVSRRKAAEIANQKIAIAASGDAPSEFFEDSLVSRGPRAKILQKMIDRIIEGRHEVDGVWQNLSGTPVTDLDWDEEWGAHFQLECWLTKVTARYCTKPGQRKKFSDESFTHLAVLNGDGKCWCRGRWCDLADPCIVGWKKLARVLMEIYCDFRGWDTPSVLRHGHLVLNLELSPNEKDVPFLQAADLAVRDVVHGPQDKSFVGLFGRLRQMYRMEPSKDECIEWYRRLGTVSLTIVKAQRLGGGKRFYVINFEHRVHEGSDCWCRRLWRAGEEIIQTERGLVDKLETIAYADNDLDASAAAGEARAGGQKRWKEGDSGH